METIVEAIKSARYNEAVIIKVEQDGDGENDSDQRTQEIILTAALDEKNGGVTWTDVRQAHRAMKEEDLAIVRHLRTKRWVLPMLNDSRRNQLYDAAIRAASEAAVHRFQSQLSSHADSLLHAFDIGSGTGLLAMMACKHAEAALQSSNESLKSRVHVTSVEMASAMATLARRVVRCNGLEDSITIVEEHSTDSETRLPQRAHLCTSELLESGLLGEGLLPALRDAWERHLHPDAVMVPQKARVFAQLVESSDFAAQLCGPYPFTQQEGYQQLKFSISSSGTEMLCGQPAESAEGFIINLHAEKLFSTSGSDDCPSMRVLTDPVMVMDFSFSRNDIPSPDGGNSTVFCISIAPGVVHAVLFWWELDLWDDLTYSTEPGKGPWQDHWHQCLFVPTVSPNECPRLSQGDHILLTCFHTDYRLWFSVQQEPSGPSMNRPRCAHSTKSAFQWMSPDRVRQLKDARRSELLRRGVSTALSLCGIDAPVLDLSDFSLCSILAALQGARAATSLESSSGKIPELSARISQIGNNLPLSWDGIRAQYQILQCHADDLTLDLMCTTSPATLVVAEPYYELLEGWHLQEALNYHYLIKSLKKKGLISDAAAMVPAFASVMACAIGCPSLAKAYGRVGEDKVGHICGFDHSLVNELGARYHQQDLSLRMCEYEHTKMSEPVELARICFADSSIEGDGEWRRMAFGREGTCNGVMCWVDYAVRVGMESRKQHVQTMTTLCHKYKQLIRMLPSPVEIFTHGTRESWLLCRVKLGGLDGPEDHDFEVSLGVRETLIAK